MRIQIFQHERFESPAVIEDWIRRKKYTPAFTRFYENDRLPEIDEFDWLIVMGGPMSANDEDKYPWLKEEKQFIRKAIEERKTVLGICLGSQLIAASLGYKVYPNRFKEIGWMDVSLTQSAKDNVVFNSLPETLKVCQWHGDTFDLPDGAVLLAESVACKNQAFIYNNRVLGLQFHLEFNEKTIKDLVSNCRKELVKAEYVQTEKKILHDLTLLGSANKLLFKILDGINSVK